MSTKSDRNMLPLEVKKIIIQLKEKNMTIAKIGEAAYKEYGIKTSKSTIHRTFGKKTEILATIENGK